MYSTISWFWGIVDFITVVRTTTEYRAGKDISHKTPYEYVDYVHTYVRMHRAELISSWINEYHVFYHLAFAYASMIAISRVLNTEQNPTVNNVYVHTVCMYI